MRSLGEILSSQLRYLKRYFRLLILGVFSSSIFLLLSSSHSQSQTINIVSAFDGLHQGWAGPTIPSSVPPDVIVAAGLDHVMEMTNDGVGIWRKGGTHVESLTLYTFFNVNTDDYVTDPWVLYDAPSGRWFASIWHRGADFTRDRPSRVLLAVSSTSDPTGSWTIHSFEMPSSGDPCCPTAADRPVIGVSDDKLAVSILAIPVGLLGLIINKSDLLTGSPAPRNTFLVLATGGARYTAVQSLSSTTTQFLVRLHENPPNTFTIEIRSVTGVPPGPVTVDARNVSISGFSWSLPNAVQAGTNNRILVSSEFDAFWQNGKLWLALVVGCIPTDAAGTPDTEIRSCIRIIQIDTNTYDVTRDFTFGSFGSFYFYPALRTDSRGNPVVVFGYSSATDFPGLMVATQTVGDPPDTVQGPQILRRGSGPETGACSASGCRYGDYFGAAVDPSDPTVVWVAGEYGAMGGWATFVASIRVTLSTVALNLSYSVQGGGSPSPPTFTYTSHGVNQSAALSTSRAHYSVDAGSSWSVTNPLSGSLSDERWLTNQPTAGTARSYQALNFIYSRQYRLTIEPNPPQQSGVWVLSACSCCTAGASVSVGAGATQGWRFAEWRGSGEGSYSGTTNPTTVTMDSPITQMADFSAGLTITADPGGSVTYAHGMTQLEIGPAWSIPGGTSHTIYIRPQIPGSLGQPIERTVVLGARAYFPYRLTGWTGALPFRPGTVVIGFDINNLASPITVDLPSDVVAHFALDPALIGLIGASILALGAAGLFVVRKLRKRGRT